MNKKTYILDTNIFLYDPRALFAFEDNDIIIPLSVIEELDKQKKRGDEVGRNARETTRQLDDLRSSGNLSTGVPLPKGGTLKIEINNKHVDEHIQCPGIDFNTIDNRILSLAFNLKAKTKQPIIIVTKDLNLRIKADVMGITAQDFFNDKIDFKTLYTGQQGLYIKTEQLETFYDTGFLSFKGDFYSNQCVVLRSDINNGQSALAIYKDESFTKLIYNDKKTVYGIKALNKEQRFALSLLLDDDIKIVTLVGKAGTGKTLLALAAGLEKIFEDKSKYNKVLISRPVVPLGNDLGYLPGDKDEKLRPWMSPIFDNLEFLCNCYENPSKKNGNGHLDYLFHSEKIELEALTYMRGRSIPNKFLIIDEAQNLTPKMIKTILSRVGKDTKIVFTGDPEQIDDPYLDAESNGLSFLVEKIKKYKITGHIILVKGERSEVAEIGAEL